MVEFIEPLTNQLVEEGGHVTFSCILNFDDVMVAWYKNELKLHRSRDIDISSDGALHTITFKKVTLDDQGVISLRAENLQVNILCLYLFNE